MSTGITAKLENGLAAAVALVAMMAGAAHAVTVTVDPPTVCRGLQAQYPGSTVSVSAPGIRIACPGSKGQPRVSLKAADAVEIARMAEGYK